MKTRRRGVNETSTSRPRLGEARKLGDRGAATRAARRSKGTGVLDLLYAGVVIAVFAVLLLAVRGLDRL